MQKRFMVVSLLCMSLLAFSLPSLAQSDFVFESTPCPVDIPLGLTEGTGALGIECGVVEVPEFHAVADGNTIEVAVAVLNSSSGNPAEPLFMEQGGPGGSTIDLFVQLAPLFLPILQERDIVLVEQRGTLYSDPVLTCPESVEFILDNISVDPYEDEDLLDNQVAATQACFDRLAADGVNLSAFNSVENANDMIAVADALGYEQINFYGVSYGTMLGQHLLRDHEARLNSIIFDAVVPLEGNFLPDILVTGRDALQAVFASCAADTDCNSLYPDLENVFWDTHGELNQNPILLPTVDPETGIEYEAFFNGDSLLGLIRGLQYTAEFVPSIPYFIYASSEDNFEWAERVNGIFLINAGRDIAEAMYTSVLCAEDGDFTIDDVNTEGIRQEILDTQLDFIASFPELCELGNIQALDSFVDDPVISDIPALITSGGFDPITPARYGDVLAGNLSNSTHLVFPSLAHGAILGGQCPLGIMTQFLSNPEAELDTSCMDNMGITYNEFVIGPRERLTFPVPDGFESVGTEDYASYVNADNITVSIIAIDELDIETVIDTALRTIIREDFDRPILVEQTAEDSFGEVTNHIYQDGAKYIAVLAQNQGDISSAIVMEFSPLQLTIVDPILIPIATNLIVID